MSPQARRQQPAAAWLAAWSKLPDTAALLGGCASLLGPVCHARAPSCTRGGVWPIAARLRLADADIEADTLGLHRERHRLLLAFREHDDGQKRLKLWLQP